MTGSILSPSQSVVLCINQVVYDDKAMRSAEPWFISYFAKLGKLDGRSGHNGLKSFLNEYSYVCESAILLDILNLQFYSDIVKIEDISALNTEMLLLK